MPNDRCHEIVQRSTRARSSTPTLELLPEQDPLGFDAGDSNLYRYVRNNPVAAVDPFGMDNTTLTPDFSEEQMLNTPLGQMKQMIQKRIDSLQRDIDFYSTRLFRGFGNKAVIQAMENELKALHNYLFVLNEERPSVDKMKRAFNEWKERTEKTEDAIRKFNHELPRRREEGRCEPEPGFYLREWHPRYDPSWFFFFRNRGFYFPRGTPGFHGPPKGMK